MWNWTRTATSGRGNTRTWKVLGSKRTAGQDVVGSEDNRGPCGHRWRRFVFFFRWGGVMNIESIDEFDSHQPCPSSTQKWINQCVGSAYESMEKVWKAGVTAGVSTFHPFSKEPIKYPKHIFRMVRDFFTLAFNILSAADFKGKSVTKSNVWSVSFYYVAGERKS